MWIYQCKYKFKKIIKKIPPLIIRKKATPG